MGDAALWISFGEGVTGVLSMGIGCVMFYAGYLAPNEKQRCLRAWAGAFCFVMGLEEFLDAFFTEGDAIAMIPQIACTAVQLVTSAGAVWFLSKVDGNRWRIDLTE